MLELTIRQNTPEIRSFVKHVLEFWLSHLPPRMFKDVDPFEAVRYINGLLDTTRSLVAYKFISLQLSLLVSRAILLILRGISNPGKPVGHWLGDTIGNAVLESTNSLELKILLEELFQQTLVFLEERTELVAVDCVRDLVGIAAANQARAGI